MPTLTIFTPTYNRAHTLGRTYESLCAQECRDFCWLIIDDGSTDRTKDLVSGWAKKDSGFEIRYLYKENGGVHTAHNLAYEKITTELCMCIDSDDTLAPGAAALIVNTWEKVRGNGYAGLIGLDADFKTGQILGGPFPDHMKETTFSGYYAAGGTGEKKLVYRTEAIRSVQPYPVMKGETYVDLNFKYLLLDRQYKLYVINEVLCYQEEQPDGYNSNMHRQYLQNPKGFAYIRKEYIKNPLSKKEQFIDCIHYASCSQLAGNANYLKESPKKWMTVLAVPFAWSMTKFLKSMESAEQRGMEHFQEETRLMAKRKARRQKR